MYILLQDRNDSLMIDEAICSKGEEEGNDNITQLFRRAISSL